MVENVFCFVFAGLIFCNVLITMASRNLIYMGFISGFKSRSDSINIAKVLVFLYWNASNWF